MRKELYSYTQRLETLVGISAFDRHLSWCLQKPREHETWYVQFKSQPRIACTGLARVSWPGIRLSGILLGLIDAVDIGSVVAL